MQYRAPAKLNLFLHVTGRRPDGFHDLETVFQLIDLHDILTINARDDGRIVREPPPSDALLKQLPDSADLTVRAARLLQEQSGTHLGASIHVEKHIPAGAGLGGGSSDAASVLVALNSLWGLNWSVERIAALGLTLGSDVPVFVYGRNAFAAGRGERLLPLAVPSRWFLIVDAGVAVSTRELFAAPELTRNTPPLTICALPGDGGRNDFEPVVCARYPRIAGVFAALAPFGPRLTGTGGCVFTAFDSQATALEVAAGLPAEWRTFVVRGLDS
jgi:4-diphosphocytidyl-2-C-methyl-D-erythritol kinase